ncbi:MAG: nitroreductase [Firmicutes bacterium HGW-Firmicutes-16]|nr:MAG: nitroreductase [Firmicutes bacterium HGW-Firmicutes-16]
MSLVSTVSLNKEDSMETLKCIETRRSIRKYLNKPIEHELIEKLVSEAQNAPTWKNSQTTRFTAVTDRTVLNEICSALPSFNSAVVGQCPLLIAVSAVTKRSGFERDGTPTTILGEAYTYFDCGATVQTFCLAANDFGVGTVILGIFEPAKIRTLLDIPESEDLVVLVACGYTETEAPAPQRRPLYDVLRII